MASQEGFAERVARKHIARAKESNRQAPRQVRAREQAIQETARGMGLGRITDRQEYRQAREQYRSDRAGERRAAETPSDYMDKYGSMGPDMYRADQLKQEMYEKRTANIPAEYKEKYGSQAEAMFRAEELNRTQTANARETFAPGSSEQRSIAMKEAMDSARSTGGRFGQAASAGEDSLRDLYRKEYAQWGDNPDVIGLKDVQELENRGYSGGDIRRIGLTVGSVGPKARERIGLITGTRL